jgi:cytochrome c oxidase subunit 2
MQASAVSDWLSEWESQERTEDILIQKADVGSDLSRRKVEKKGSPMKHVIGALILIVALTAVSMFVLRTDILLPEQASLQAQRIDWLFNIQFKIIAFLFALIVGLAIYSVIFFRRKKGDTTDGAYLKGNDTLEYTWTALPLVVVIGLAYIGSGVLADTMRMDPRALEVRVIGQQWSWRFEYPDQEITSTELVLPVDKQVLLQLTSEDVIHSFWVPEFRVKQDAIPGSFRELRVTPNTLGEYQMVCTELCGQQHAYMTAPVRVVSQAEFDEWVSATQIPTEPVARGEYWYRTEGCASCHSLDGSKIVGPSFKGLYGRTEAFVDGSSLTVDEAYLTESILNPYAKIVEGYELSPGSGTSAMPANYGEKLSAEQIQEIIEFIKTLK